MKIGYDAKRLFTNVTGLGNYSRSLVRNLQHFYPVNQYHLYTTEARNNERSADFFSSGKYHIHESKALIKGYWRSYSIVKELKNEKIELYHGLSNELPVHLHRAGIKSIVTIHDLIFKVYPETYRITERIVYDSKFKYACAHADKIIAISESTKRDIIQYYGIDAAKIEVIYQACHPLFYTLRPRAENIAVLNQYGLPPQYFLYVGSVEKRKNLELIIEAYKAHAVDFKIPLVIIGKGGHYKAVCQKLIEQYNLQHYFIWPESLKDNHHLQSIYQCATALIYPSFYEGFGLPVAEALLCKTPVITADTSSLREAGGLHSIYIDPKNKEALSAAMLLILNNKDYATKMSEEGYLYAHRLFDTKALTGQMMGAYKSILGQ